MTNKYKKYDSSIQDAIIKSGNINLYPELKIPRSTAMSWIRTAKKKITLKEFDYEAAYKCRIKKLEQDLENEKAKTIFIKDLFMKFSNKESFYSLKKNKEVLVKVIEKYKERLSVSEMCRILGLLSNSYYRYKIDILGCPRISFKKCKILSPNQLTFREQEKIHNLVNDKSLSHLSIKGLQFHAFRNGILSCGYDSWRKYTKEFRGEGRVVRKKKYRTGIRAKKVNEIWHIDITQFRLKDGKVVYLQAIMDNFSRKIINWKFSSNKKDALSINSIVRATKEQVPEVLMSDGGGENTSHRVKGLLEGRGIVSLIAKKDTLFSSSMIEGFFNILKNRFLDKFKKYKRSKLYKSIQRAVEYFNNAPSSVLFGATPIELYEDKVKIVELKEKLKNELLSARLIRPSLNKKCFRQTCTI